MGRCASAHPCWACHSCAATRALAAAALAAAAAAAAALTATLATAAATGLSRPRRNRATGTARQLGLPSQGRAGAERVPPVLVARRVGLVALQRRAGLGADL